MLTDTQKETLLDYILENSQDIITLTDTDFNYITCSRIFPRLFNLHHKSEVIGKNIRQILPNYLSDTIIEKFHKVIETREPKESIFEIKYENKSKIFSHVSIPFVKNCEITGVLSVFKDITLEENLKCELLKKINQLKILLDNEKHLKAQKEIFLVTLTHDLKNPIQSQTMALKMLKDNNLDKETKIQIIDTLLESSQHMNLMLNSIIQTYKIDNGVIELHKTLTDLNSIIIKCIAEVDILVKSKNLKIIYNSKSVKIYCDASLIRRVIGNIINNAIKHAFENSAIIINVYTQNDKCYFEFCNKGKPIPEDIKNHLFEKYITGNQLTGIGLGLYFSKKVINAHNGTIFLENKDDTIKFIFYLPISDKTKSKIDW